MAHKPDDKRDDKDDKKDDKKVDTKPDVKAGAQDPRANKPTVLTGGDKVGAHEGEPAPPGARPNVLSPTSDQLQFVVEAHAEVFSPDELSVLAAAVTELKDYEVLTAPPPPPVVRDVPYVGQEGPLLNCTMGNWEGEPTQYTYDWHRDGTFVVGGASNNYTVLTEDVGTTFTCVVTASNGSGATQAPPSNPVVVTDPTAVRAART
jgi:hypothetical protein